MDFWAVTRVLVAANNLAQSVRQVTMDKRVTTDELLQVIMPNVIVLLKTIDSKLDTAKLEESLKTQDLLGQAYASVRTLPGSRM